MVIRMFTREGAEEEKVVHDPAEYLHLILCREPWQLDAAGR
jgi:hypothetical protein